MVFFYIDVLIFERSREIDRKKKIDRPRIAPVSWQNKLASGQFSALFACAKEATVRELRNYMNNKTSDKYHTSVSSSFSKTKVSFVFCSTKDLQKIPLENWVFSQALFLENEAQINKNNYTTMLFISKQLSLPKISSILQKMKIGPKCHICPFCTKPFYFNSQFCQVPLDGLLLLWLYS